MDFSNFLMLRQEMGLVAVFLILLVVDIFAPDGRRTWFRPLACTLMALQTAWGFLPIEAGTAFGGMYVTSPLIVLMKNILTMGTFIAFLQASAWLLKTDDMARREGEFYSVMAATLLGMYLMVSAGNFMMLYIGIELASLPLACLAAWNKYQEKSAEAGAKYILISALSSGVMMFGLSFLYGALGTMYFTDLNAAMITSPMTLMGFVFFFAGLAFKVSLVPFHLWTADVYEGAPTAVTGFLSVVSKGAASFTLILTLYHVFGSMQLVWHHILWGLAAVTIIVGNLFAIRQKDIKRFFAFSSISQAGYIMLGVMSGTPQGMTSTVYYMLVYLFSNLAAFGVIAAVDNHTGRTDITAYKGFYKNNPVLAFVMMLAVFSLAGIPPFAGFFSKFAIFAAAAEVGDYLLVFIALVNTVVSLYYYLLIIKAMFITPEDTDSVGRITTDRYNGLSIVLCTAGVIAVGLLGCIYAYIHAVA